MSPNFRSRLYTPSLALSLKDQSICHCTWAYWTPGTRRAVLHFKSSLKQSTPLEWSRLRFWHTQLHLITVHFCNNLHESKQMRWVNQLSPSLIYFISSCSPFHLPSLKVHIFSSSSQCTTENSTIENSLNVPFIHRWLAWLTKLPSEMTSNCICSVYPLVYFSPTVIYTMFCFSSNLIPILNIYRLYISRKMLFSIFLGTLRFLYKMSLSLW